MNAAFGWRFFAGADFFAAGFFAALFFAAGFFAALFFAAGFFAALFFAAGFFAVFFAAFLAVAMFLLPVSCAGGTLQRPRRVLQFLRHDAPSAATIPHFPRGERGFRGKFRTPAKGVATSRTCAFAIAPEVVRRSGARRRRSRIDCDSKPMSAAPTDLARLRTDYKRAALGERDVAADPIAQFSRWFDEAVAAQVPEANAMTLATVDADGQPAARIVLLKAVDARGFVFHTNYDSRKGRDIEANPRVALVFFWPELERQVRVEGRAGRITAKESDDYFG